MAVQIRSEYHTLLGQLINNGKKFSPYRPWPNTNYALLCIYGWVRRNPYNDDWIEITDMGRKVYETAEVHS